MPLKCRCLLHIVSWRFSFPPNSTLKDTLCNCWLISLIVDVVLGIEARAVCTPGKHCITQLHPSLDLVSLSFVFVVVLGFRQDLTV